MEVIRKHIIYFYVLLVTVALLPKYSSATGGCTGLCNPLEGVNSVETLIERFLQAIVYVGLPLSVLFIVYAGFRFVAAQGNKDEIVKAKHNFFWGVVGIILILGASALAALIRGTVDELRN